MVFNPGVFAGAEGTQGSQARYSEAATIAVVKPVFTATAYSSFYAFYSTHTYVKPGSCVTDPADLRQLTAPLVETWGWSNQLRGFVDSVLRRELKLQVQILTDVDVNDGALFHQGTRSYDLLILGFTEYVTAAEYQQYLLFVRTGGRIIFVDATQFLAEVKYDPASGKVSLVSGHGWSFNGSCARKGVYERWFDENTLWVGSNYGVPVSEAVSFRGAVALGNHPLSVTLRRAFGDGARLFVNYHHHEENVLTNSSAEVIARWVSDGGDSSVVAAYELRYGEGFVLHTGIFGSDILTTDKQMKFFVKEMVVYALGGREGQRGSWTQTYLNASSADSLLSPIFWWGRLVGREQGLLFEHGPHSMQTPTIPGFEGKTRGV